MSNEALYLVRSRGTLELYEWIASHQAAYNGDQIDETLVEMTPEEASQVALREGVIEVVNPEPGRFENDEGGFVYVFPDGSVASSEDHSLYDAAKERVEDTPELSPHADFILADWPEGAEHWVWVIESSVQEILSWVEAGKA